MATMLKTGSMLYLWIYKATKKGLKLVSITPIPRAQLAQFEVETGAIPEISNPINGCYYYRLKF